MKFFPRFASRAGLAGALVLSSLAIVSFSNAPDAQAAKPVRAKKFGVCHRTNAIKNPYRYITVAWSSVDPNGNGHDSPSHDGRVFNYADPTASHGTVPRDFGTDPDPTNDRWGDIFNAYKGPGNGNSNSNNWTADGIEIFENGAINDLTNKPACRAMSITEYILSELEAVRDQPDLRDENGNPITMETVMEELDEMGSTEDEATKKALGGSFSTWYTNNGGGSQDPALITSLIASQSPRVATTAPTNVLVSGSPSRVSATLNGTIDPEGESMVHYFEFHTDPTFPDASTETVAIGTSPRTTAGPVSASVTGLTVGTTYYYRIVGVISNGLTGDDLVETVLIGATEQFNSGAAGAPTISSLTCGNQKLTVAFSGSPDTVDKYQYSVDGGTWNDSPQSGTTSFDISSLTNGTTYSIRLRGFVNSGNVPGYSSAASEATPCGLPGATTRPATSVQNVSAVLNGLITSNGAATTVKFQYKEKGSAASCANADVDFGTGVTERTIAQAVGATAIDSAQTVTLTLLSPSTAYCYRIVGTNTPGSATGDGVLFTTTAAAQPTVTTEPATSVTPTTATINGTGIPNGAATSARFTYKASSTDFSTDSTTVSYSSSLGSGSSSVNFSVNLTNLTPGTTYYFKASVSNANTTGYIDGITRSFTTPLPPEATTTAATAVTETTATLNGTIDPNNISTDVEFTWGTDPTLNTGNTVVAAIESPLSPTPNGAAVTVALSGLTGGTTYYFQVSASNVNGDDDGEILSFTTSAPTQNVQNVVDDPGRVIGTAWFDVNKNNKRDADEPLLPGVPVELSPTATVASQSLRGLVRSKATTQTLTTNADGSFDFSTVAPGTYKISGTLPGSFGIQQSWDSTGNDDWAVFVTVVARETSRGDFAAIGEVVMSGVIDDADCETLNQTGDVTMTWSGFDQKIGNTDDTSFESELNSDCTFDVEGVPTGKYKLTVQNPTTKKTVSVQSLAVPARAKNVRIDVSNKTATITVIQGITLSSIPKTGVSAQQLGMWASLLALAGFVMTQTSVLTRRRIRRR